MNKILQVIVLLLLSFNCIASAQSLKQYWVDSTYNALSLDQKLGQLFIVAAYTNKDDAHHKEIIRLIEKENIGGLIFMQDNPEKQIDFTNIYQPKAKIPLLLGMDAEWDLSMRLKNTFKFPFAMTLGAIQDNHLVFLTGKKIAQHAKRLGVLWNFAPVVDVNTNPNNPIIGNRSFGSDIYNVANKGTAYMLGMKSEGVIASAKHFPGHGDTQTDSHYTTPLLNHSLQRLDSVELYPFKKLIENNVDGIMIAHLSIPAIEKTSNPSTLSYAFVTEILKKKLNYNNLVITDALNMEGVAAKFPPGVVDMMAFKAGNDIMLFSQDVVEAKKQIIQAIQKKEINESRVEESVKKILSYKFDLGLTYFNSIKKENILEDLNDKQSDSLKYQLYAHAITLVQNNDHFLPLQKKTILHYYNITGGDDTVFLSELQKKYTIKKVSKQDIKNLPKESTLILANFLNTNSVYALYKLSEEQIETIEKQSDVCNTLLVHFGSPYSFRNVKTQHMKSFIITYENQNYTQEIVAKQLAGDLQFLGKLPVSVNEELPFGKGIVYETK